MAYKPLSIGASANDGTGDTIRGGADKTNDNFEEIYERFGDGTSLTSGISATATVVTLTSPVLTGVIAFSDGSVVSPSITNTGDLNTGFYFDEADTVNVTTGGAKRITIDSSGLDVTGNITISNAGTIGSVSDIDAIAISSGGGVTFSQTPIFSLDVTIEDDLFLDSDAAVVHLGEDGDVTLTHVADTGVLLNSTRQLQFGDSGTYIHQSADGVLDLVSDTEIEINATTIDVNGTTNFSGAITPAASDGAALGTTALEWSDLFLADGGVIYFGDDQEIKITHVADDGLTLKNAGTGNAGFTFNLVTGDTAITVNNILGAINFAAPDEASGTDAILNGARIIAISEGTFAADNNATTLDFRLGVSGAPSEAFKMTSGGDFKLVQDAAVLGFGADNDVTLTHVADTGLLLNSTMALQFNDSSQFINAPSATVLDINATDEIELNATLVDVNANVEISGTAAIV